MSTGVDPGRESPVASVAFFSTDMSRNAVYVPWQFRGALEGEYRVSLLGPASGELWTPLTDRLRPSAILPSSGPGTKEYFRGALDASEGADLLYAFKAFPESFGVALKVGAALGVPVALHLCDWDGGFFSDRSRLRQGWYALRGLGNPRGPWALKAMERSIPKADLLTVSSRALQRRFGGTLVPQGVDVDSFSPARLTRKEARERVGVPEEEELVLFLGTPRLHKGIGDVAAGLKRLGRKGVRFLVVGAQGTQDGILELVDVPGLEVRAPVPLFEAPWFFRAADLFVIPQRPTRYAHHQLPAKLLMAMAMGTPILATDVGDAMVILGGDPPAGRVVPPADTAALEEGMRELLANPDLREAMGAEARRRAVERFSWPAMRTDLYPLLQSLLET